MENKSIQEADVGVIVGRFQVHELTRVHKDLIQTVLDRHDKVIIFLGIGHQPTTSRNPLDYMSRQQMIASSFPEDFSKMAICPISDCLSDETWSISLDAGIHHLLGPRQTALLYGGTDSFIAHYSGKYPTQELVPREYVKEYRGTELRNRLGNRVIDTPEFRAGVVWATRNKFPAVISTVDIAILNRNKEEVLLGRKEGEKGWRFIGGHVDPGESFEEAARREAREETAYDMEFGPPSYIGSYFIDDWRYKNEDDKVTTAFFAVDYLYGAAKFADDIVEVKWIPFKHLTDNHVGLQMVPAHTVLKAALVDYLKLEEENNAEQSSDAD